MDTGGVIAAGAALHGLAVESLCPVCFAPAPGRYEVSAHGVELVRDCPAHGEARALVERDAAFLAAARALVGRGARPQRRQLVVMVTYRCNMGCRLCYLPDRDPSMDMEAGEVERILAAHPGHAIAFGGGEPTLHEELPRMLGAARRLGLEASIVTNGLRLAEPGFLPMLVRAGLSGVILSFNSADGATSAAMDGRDCLAEKLAALEALRRNRVRVTLSMSVARGVNDHQVGTVLDLALRHFPVTRTVLFENCAGIGRSPGGEPFRLSELVALLAGELGVEPRRLLDMAEAGKASVDPYSVRTHLGALPTSSAGGGGEAGRIRWLAGRVGVVAAARFVLDAATRRDGFRMRLLTSVTPENYDRAAVAATAQSCVLAAARGTPVLPLWEYFRRYHGAAAGAASG